MILKSSVNFNKFLFEIFQDCFKEQRENFLSRFDDVTMEGSIGGGLLDVLEDLCSKGSAEKQAAQFAGLGVEEQVAKFNEVSLLKNSIGQIKKFEDLVVSVTEHWMTANKVAGLTLPSQRKLKRIYQLSKQGQVLKWMGYEALQQPNFCQVFVSSMKRPKMLFRQVTKMLAFTSDVTSLIDVTFESPNFKSIAYDYFSAKSVIIECLRCPADKGIQNLDHLERVLLDTLPRHMAFRNNIYRIR